MASSEEDDEVRDSSEEDDCSEEDYDVYLARKAKREKRAKPGPSESVEDVPYPTDTTVEYYNDKELGLIRCNIQRCDNLEKMQAITVSVRMQTYYK